MVKKILSIDFDIICYPCIRLYNHMVHGAESPVVTWNSLNESIDIQNALSYDSNTLLDIAKLIRKNVQSGAKLRLIEEHQHLVDALKLDENYSDTTYDIYNIDFHHDLWYHKEDLTNMVDFDDYTCANWLGYLLLKGKTNSVHWLKAPNSDMPTPFISEDPFTSILKIRDFDKIEEEFDEIYFCFSPQWTPHQYRVFYKLIAATLGNADESNKFEESLINSLNKPIVNNENEVNNSNENEDNQNDDVIGEEE